MKKNFKWQLKDIIMIAILGLIFAVIYLGILYAGVGVTAILTPLGLLLSDMKFFTESGLWEQLLRCL